MSNGFMLPFGSQPVSAIRGRFQLPQAISAFRGNQLNPKRKMHFVIRGRKAGDFGAFWTGLLSLTSLHPNRGMRYWRVSHYAIGIGYQNASLRTLRQWGAPRHCQPACVTREHCPLSSARSKHRNNASQRLSSLRREGKSELLSAGGLFSRTVNTNQCFVRLT